MSFCCRGNREEPRDRLLSHLSIGVIRKYGGETEKNLSRVIDDAEDAKTVLFFDEADALFGKRSEVKDSHDRYASVEINDLLQQSEEQSA